MKPPTPPPPRPLEGTWARPEMIPRLQMIPKMDRKWSPTANDPRSEPQMILRKQKEWSGVE